MEAYTLFIRKNQQYGNSIEETGTLGAVVEVVAKTARLRELVVRSSTFGIDMTPEELESVGDNLLDLLNYAAIGLVMLNKANYRGKELGND